MQQVAPLLDHLVGFGNGKVVGRTYNGQEGASVWPLRACFSSLYRFRTS